MQCPLICLNQPEIIGLLLYILSVHFMYIAKQFDDKNEQIVIEKFGFLLNFIRLWCVDCEL